MNTFLWLLNLNCKKSTIIKVKLYADIYSPTNRLLKLPWTLTAYLQTKIGKTKCKKYL